MTREKVGEVWVDTGQLIIVDPGYLHDWEANRFDDEDPEDNSFSYAGACNTTLGVGAGQLAHGAVVSNTAGGDGVYPVYAEIISGRVQRLIIELGAPR
jgi:hypothetical protein